MRPPPDRPPASLLDQPRVTVHELAEASRLTTKRLKSLLAEHGVTVDAPGTKRQGVYTVELRDKLGVFCDSLEDVEARRARRGDAAPPDEPDDTDQA